METYTVVRYLYRQIITPLAFKGLYDNHRQSLTLKGLTLISTK